MIDYYQRERDLDGPTNSDRADWAREVTQEFTNAHYGMDADRDLDDDVTVDQNVSDFLCDLMHWLGEDRVRDLVERGTLHYVAEVAEENEDEENEDEL